MVTLVVLEVTNIESKPLVEFLARNLDSALSLRVVHTSRLVFGPGKTVNFLDKGGHELCYSVRELESRNTKESEEVTVVTLG